MHLASNTSSSSPWILVWVLFLTLSIDFSAAVKHETYKTCDQSGFCRRNRAFADATIASSSRSQYELNVESATFANGQFRATVVKTIADGATVELPLNITFLKSGLARVTLEEERRRLGDIELRHGSKARKQRYNESPVWAVVGGLDVDVSARLSEKSEDEFTVVQFGKDSRSAAIILHNPFSIYFQTDGETQIVFNNRGFLNFEHWRPKIEPKIEDGEAQEAAVEDQSTWWEESFGGNTDTKPKGPESIGLDISFPGYEHVFGIPEHTGPLSLRQTRGGGEDAFTDPYRMYNSDVFEYELNSPMTLYGSIPFMQAHRKGSSVGILWLNAAETWVDITKKKRSNPKLDTDTHWISESGILDVFVFLGPKPQDLTKALGDLTGNTQLPQHFSIGYHQCRWNYMSDEEVKEVDAKFDKHGIPYDVIWLDLEYTDDRKYFTYDPDKFQNPIAMQSQLDERHRKVVALIDPHIKNAPNYPVVDELKKRDLTVNNKDGDIFEGWCWPGSSHWIDCFSPVSRAWWATLFKVDYWKGSTYSTYIWNDMNEPSVFNGPEMTMPKDNLHYDNWEHRDVHNLNGMTFVNATYHALLDRKPGKPLRPFTLTRSFYAGSQRLGAMWTGDNLAEWGHLKESLPMILSLNIAGFPNSGADVGGFFGTPSKELLTRWFQVGTFYPFFRAHAHIDTRRREPYVAGPPFTGIMTQAIRLRYQLLPAWYTAFHEASVDNTPIVRPQYYVHPGDEAGFGLDDQFYVGSTGLLVKPVTKEGATNVDVYLADDELYYDYFDYTVYSRKGFHTVDAPLDRIPVFARGGHIIPRKDRPRRSSRLMQYDPITLVVVLGKSGNAHGSLYIDDGETFDYESGAQIFASFDFDTESSTLRSQDMATIGKLTKAYRQSMDSVRVEKIIVVGAPIHWAEKKNVLAEQDSKELEAELQFHPASRNKAAWAIVRDPKVSIARDWKIVFA